MIRKSLKNISFLLVLSLFIGCFVARDTNLFAKEYPNVDEIVNGLNFGETTAINVSNNIRLGITKESTYIYIVENNEEQNTVTLLKKDYQGNVIFNEVFNTKEEPFEPQVEGISTRAASKKQNTFSDYEYTVWYTDPTEWELRIPGGSFRTYETNHNRNYINSFYNAVEKINSLELKYISTVGLQGLTMVLVAIATGGIAALISGAAIGGAAQAIAIDLHSEINKALHFYNLTYPRRSY